MQGSLFSVGIRASASIRVVICVWSLAAVAACGGNRSQYAEMGESFSKGYQSANELLQENLTTVTRDIRRLSIVYYLKNGNNSANLDAADVPQSFKRYVCSGVGRNRNLFAALKVLDSYRAMISDLSTAPSDDLGKLWASIQKLQEPNQPLALPRPDPAAYADCLASLAKLVPPVGETIEVEGEEAVAIAGIFAAYEAINKLIDALKKVAVVALKQVDEAARAKAIREFVQANKPVMDSVLGVVDAKGKITTPGLLNDAALEDLLDRRKSSALVVAYYTFDKMLKLNRTSAGHEILKLEANVHGSLAEFDGLRRRKPPEDVVKAMRATHAKLVDLANSKIGVGDAWAAFQAFAAATKALNDAVTDAAQKSKDARGAIGNL